MRFAHPLLLSAARGTVSSTERSRLHAHAARAFHTAPGGLDLACAHLLEVDPAGDPQVVAVLRHGASNARAVGAPESAAIYLRRALAEPPTPDEAAEIYLDLAHTALEAQVPDALDIATQAVERATNPTGAVAAAIIAGHLIALDGRAPDAIDRLTDVYDAHALPRPLAEAAMTLALAWTCCSAAARGSDGDLVRSARALMESPDAPLALRSLMSYEAAAGNGSAKDCVDIARSAWADGALLREVGLTGPFVHFPVIACGSAGEMNLVERWGQRIQAEAVRLGSGHGRGISSGWLAWAAESRADLALARAYASEAFDILSPSGRMNLMLPISVSLLGDVALVTDGPDAALSALELLPRPARDPLLTNSPMWWLAHARAALAAGRPERRSLIWLKSSPGSACGRPTSEGPHCGTRWRPRRDLRWVTPIRPACLHSRACAAHERSERTDRWLERSALPPSRCPPPSVSRCSTRRSALPSARYAE